MTKTPSDIPPDSAPVMATPHPPPPPQPGEKQGVTTCGMLKATPVPATKARPPAPHGVDGAPFDVNDAPIVSDSSATLFSPGTNADDGLITPCGKTTPFHAVVPQEIIQPRVTTGNPFGAFSSNEDEPPPVPTPPTAPTATMLVPTYRDVHRAVEQNLDLLISNIHQRERAHQQRLCQNFCAMMANAQKERREFESQQSSFVTGIYTKLRVIEEMVDATVVTFGGNFALVNKALTKVEETTKQMTGHLEENRSQLHQLCKNCNHLDDIDAILTRVTDRVMKLGNLTHKLDLKMSANRPATP
jgi:hypothetical protein